MYPDHKQMYESCRESLMDTKTLTTAIKLYTSMGVVKRLLFYENGNNIDTAEKRTYKEQHDYDGGRNDAAEINQQIRENR